MADLEPSKALYYPNVEFRSTAWVKNALLYWEGIVRARPPDSSPQDDPEIQQLIAAGLIEDMAHWPERRRFTPALGRRVEDLVRARGGRLPPGIPRMGPVRGDSPDLTDRLRREILEDLEGFPLAQKALAKDLEQARSLFFTFLVDKVARARGLTPVTDEPVFDAIATYLEHDGIAKDPTRLAEGAGSAIARLCLPTPSLQLLANLPVDRFVEIRQEYAAQRHRFRQRVQVHVAEIARLPTADAIKEHLEAFQREVRDDFEGAREAVKDSKARDRRTTVVISAEACLAAGEALAGATPLLGSIEGVGTLAFAVTNWFMVKRRTGGAPESRYLLSLESAAKEPWRRLSRAFRELVKE
jgi:hypothetical protein